MRDFHKRLERLETRAHASDETAHHIPVLHVPWPQSPWGREAYLAEQTPCDCHPDCPGKTVGVILPQTCRTAKPWTQAVQQYRAHEN